MRATRGGLGAHSIVAHGVPVCAVPFGARRLRVSGASSGSGAPDRARVSVEGDHRPRARKPKAPRRHRGRRAGEPLLCRLRFPRRQRQHRRAATERRPVGWRADARVLLLHASCSSPGDAGETAALVVAIQELVANGGGGQKVRRRQSAGSPGRAGSRGRVGRRELTPHLVAQIHRRTIRRRSSTVSRMNQLPDRFQTRSILAKPRDRRLSAANEMAHNQWLCLLAQCY